MIDPKGFLAVLRSSGVGFFSGVPDSTLKQFCSLLGDVLPSNQHVVSCNEGAAVALAAGYHLATGRVPLVYLQNSGLGGILNPLLSLCDSSVYGIPILFLIGWRGRPGTEDEPQHVKQGECTIPILKAIGVEFDILGADRKDWKELVARAVLNAGKTGRPKFLLIPPGAFESLVRTPEPARFEIDRDEAIAAVLAAAPNGVRFVSTTGYISQALHHIRSKSGMPHGMDFLNIGAMGYASHIALGLSLAAREVKFTCLDGDGAALMHLGGIARIGASSPKNLVHVLLNNGVHDSVGGQKTQSEKVDFCRIAEASGYSFTKRILRSKGLEFLQEAFSFDGPGFIEILVSPKGAPVVPRPKISPESLKAEFMREIKHG